MTKQGEMAHTQPQEKKNVIVLGVTQHGKSSLIEAIHRYAGKSHRADTLKIGNSIESETKECTSYAFDNVTLKNFSLVSNNKRLSMIDIINEEECPDLYDFEVETLLTDRKISFNIIDTPGLSDSSTRQEEYQQYDEEGASDEDGSRNNSLRLSSVDERHKISILAQLAKQETIHAICIVIRTVSAFTGDLQDYFRVLKDMLTESFPSASRLPFFVVHTEVLPEDHYIPELDPDEPTEIYEKKIDVLRNSFQLVFDFHGQHHFVNNPRNGYRDSMQEFFSQSALTKLLENISKSKGQKLQDLRYPKLEAHILNDRELKKSWTNARIYFERQILDRKKRIEKIEALKEDLSGQINKQDQQIDRIRSIISTLNTRTEVRGRSYTGFAESYGGIVFRCNGSHWFHITSELYIANIDRSDLVNDAWWDDSSRERGEKTYKICLRTEWPTDASGTITLLHYQRDVERATINRHESEISNIRSVQEKLRDEQIQYDGNIEMLNQEITELQKKILGCKVDERTISSREILDKVYKKPFFCVSEFGEKFKYLTANSPYAASLAYSLDTKLPIDALGPNRPDAEKFILDFENKRKQCNVELKQEAAALDALSTGFETLRSMTFAADGLLTGNNKCLEACVARTESVDGFIHASVHRLDSWKEDLSDQSTRHLSDLRQNLESKGEQVLDKALASLDEYKTYMEHRDELCSDLSRNLESFTKELDLLKQQLLDKCSRIRTRITAIDEVICLIKAQEIGIGVYSMVSRQLKENNPYSALYASVFEVKLLEQRF